MDSCTPEVNSGQRVGSVSVMNIAAVRLQFVHQMTELVTVKGGPVIPFFQCATETRLFFVLFSSTITPSRSLSLGHGNRGRTSLGMGCKNNAPNNRYNYLAF